MTLNKIGYMLLVLFMCLSFSQLHAETGDSKKPSHCPWCNSDCGVDWDKCKTPITIEEAKTVMKRYLDKRANPNLKLGKVMDKGQYYEIEIVTKDDSLVDKIMLDKKTGLFKSIY